MPWEVKRPWSFTQGLQTWQCHGPSLAYELPEEGRLKYQSEAPELQGHSWVSVLRTAEITRSVETNFKCLLHSTHTRYSLGPVRAWTVASQAAANTGS